MSRLQFLLTCLFFMVAVFCQAWDWPVENPQLTMDFASAFRGSFLPGVMVRSGNPLVHAVNEGEMILIAQDDHFTRQRFPLAFGGTIVLEHGKGLRSIYTGLELNQQLLPAGSENGRPAKLKNGELLGRLSQLGDLATQNLFFRLLDSSFATAVNPLVVFPLIPDERLPIIASTQIEALDSGHRVNITERMDVPQASFRLFIQVYDNAGPRLSSGTRSGNSAATLPYEVKVIWNGVLVYESVKLALRSSTNQDRRPHLVRNQKGDFGSVYQADGFLDAGELKLADGVNRLEIRAADLDGNRTSASFRMIHSVHQP